MQKKYIFSILAVFSGIALFNACSDDGSSETGEKPGPVIPLPPADDDDEEIQVLPSMDLRPAAMQSRDGCQLDSDCVDGNFCFHGSCTTQCTKDDECADGYVCTPRNGRCITRAFAEKMVRDDENTGDSDLTRKRHALTDLNAQDIAEAAESDVVEAVTNFEILTPPLRSEGTMNCLQRRQSAQPGPMLTIPVCSICILPDSSNPTSIKTPEILRSMAGTATVFTTI